MTTLTRLGTGGRVAGYDHLILADRVLVADDDGRTRDHAVPNHGTGIGELAARLGFRFGWGRFPDGAEVLTCTTATTRGAAAGGGQAAARIAALLPPGAEAGAHHR